MDNSLWLNGEINHANTNCNLFYGCTVSCAINQCKNIDKIQSSIRFDSHWANIVCSQRKLYHTHKYCVVQRNHIANKWQKTSDGQQSKTELKSSCYEKLQCSRSFSLWLKFRISLFVPCVKCTVYFIWHWFISKCEHSYARKHSRSLCISWFHFQTHLFTLCSQLELFSANRDKLQLSIFFKIVRKTCHYSQTDTQLTH